MTRHSVFSLILLASALAAATPAAMADPIRITRSVSVPTQQEAERIVHRLWKAIPDHGMNIYTYDGLTREFADLVEEGWAMPNTNPGGIGDNEVLWYWYTGQDSSIEDEITGIRFTAISAGRITAVVTYVTLGEAADHEVEIVKEDGRWLIEDFDGMKAPIREFVTEWRANFRNGAGERLIRENSDWMSPEDKDNYRREVREYLERFADADTVSEAAVERIVPILPEEKPMLVVKEAEVKEYDIYEVKETAQSDRIFTEVEVPASFPGGNAALMRWIANNLRYPEAAQQNGIQGRVVVKFVVNTDGSIEQATVVKGVSPDLNAEALRVVRRMPKWTPGKKDGVPVNTYCTLPIGFKLTSN